jgi:C-terminal processing protease CtpA/Prc
MRALRWWLAVLAFQPFAVFSAPQEQQQQQQEYEKLAPFETVRWKQGAVEVDLGGIGYELLEIQDLPISKVLDYCREHYKPDWHKAFEEQLVEVLSKMGKAPDFTVKVKLRRLDDGGERLFEQVMLSESNLEMVIKNRQAAPPAGPAAAEDAPGAPARRIDRAHSGKVEERFKFLTERITPRSEAGKAVLPTKKAEEDLDELEWHLANRFAYLGAKGVEYQAALDSIRAALGDGIPRGALALQVNQLLALFGDGYSSVLLDLREDLPIGYLPFAVGEIAGGRVVAFDTEAGGFVDLDHPVLKSLDGIEIDQWLEAAKSISVAGSPPAQRRASLDNLKYLNHLRGRLGLPPNEQVAVEVTTADGKQGRAVRMKLADEPPRPPFPREAPGRTLEGNVGYLRIASMTDDARILAGLHETMAAVRGTVGLVIDVRNNGGASRDVLRDLFPYFMAPGEKSRVVNVAAHRLAEGEKADEPEGFLQDRAMYPATSGALQPAEKEAAAALAQSFKPEWAPPAGQFSAWHYLVLSPRQGGPYFHYDRPVVVLMNAGCSNATDVFLAAFKGRPNVTLMGGASGGSPGRGRTVRLANSRISVRLTSAVSFRPDGKLLDGRGIEPDAEAWPEPTDVIGRTDTVLDAAVKKLQAKSGP